MPTTYTVIRRALITEKGMGVKETEGTLVFEVAEAATKTEVKQAVEALFKVKVNSVRTANFAGKERRLIVVEQGEQRHLLQHFRIATHPSPLCCQ